MAVARLRELADPLPNNLDAEKSVLGAVLLDNSALARATKTLRPEDFFLDQHRRVFTQMVALAENRQPIELVTLTEELNKRGELEAAGGVAYISSLPDGMPRVSNVEHYAHIVREKALLRRTIHVTHDIQESALRGAASAEDVLNHAVETFRDLGSTANIRPLAWLNHFKTHGQMEQGDMRFLIKDFLPEGVCFIGALSGSGKTWFALSMAKALTTGQNFLGLSRFQAPEPVNVIYLVPEAGERSFRGRMDKLGVKDRFYCRTMKDGPPPKLDDPLLLAAVRELKPVVFLDTAVRFSPAESENSSTENANGLATGVFNLLNAGAQAIVGLHHSPKGAAKQEMTLENVLRGTGDLGAMCDAVYGLRVMDTDKLELRVPCVKPRDFEPVPPFHIQGRPYINDIGDFGVLFEPSAVTKELSEDEKLAAAISASPTASYRDLEGQTGIALKRIARVAKKAGWEKIGGTWTRPENQQAFTVN